MKFLQRFPNVEIGENEAQQRFVSRMLYVLFPTFPAQTAGEVPRACSALGETLTKPREIEQVLRENFLRLLDMLERLYATLPSDSGDPRTLTSANLEQAIQHQLDSADIDLGIEWRDGRFYPRGAKLLDNALVDDPLVWLTNHGLPTVHNPLTKALSHFLRARRDPNLLADAITNAYDALEAMAKYVCGNDRTFDQNRELFLSRIKASERNGTDLSRYQKNQYVMRSLEPRSSGKQPPSIARPNVRRAWGARISSPDSGVTHCSYEKTSLKSVPFASESFKKIAKEMSSYAHTFRHGTRESNPKPTPSVNEVEAFIYSVGILIRLSISANDVQNHNV